MISSCNIWFCIYLICKHSASTYTPNLIANLPLLIDINTSATYIYIIACLVVISKFIVAYREVVHFICELMRSSHIRHYVPGPSILYNIQVLEAYEDARGPAKTFETIRTYSLLLTVTLTPAFLGVGGDCRDSIIRKSEEVLKVLNHRRYLCKHLLNPISLAYPPRLCFRHRVRH